MNLQPIKSTTDELDILDISATPPNITIEEITLLLLSRSKASYSFRHSKMIYVPRLNPTIETEQLGNKSPW